MVSTVLLREIDAYSERLRSSSALLKAARTGRLPPGALGRYVASIRYLLMQTPAHLELAIEASRGRGARCLASYFRAKLVEESGHHEWAETDMQHLQRAGLAGADPGPTSAMRALVTATRSVIERDPHHYLAYILFAEYFTVAMGPEWLRALEQGCGVPRSAMSAIGRHVELDQHHVAEGCQEIDRLLAAAPCVESLCATLRDTMRSFDRFCDELCEVA